MGSILFGILSALSWGAGDFSGGLASRRVGSYRAVLYGELLGLLLLLGAALFIHEAAPGWDQLAWSALAGLSGSCGMLILYYAIGRGQMSIAAPVSALFTALLPVIASAVMEGLPSLLKILGFALALAAVWMIAQEGDQKSHLVRLADLRLPLLSGLCFGLYFIFMHQGGQRAVIWPLIVARSTGMLTVMIFMLARRDSWRLEKAVWILIVLNGVLDVGGNAFYILAGQAGRLDVAAVLSSLYPGATVVLAWLILKERIRGFQMFGILAALIAIVFMALPG